MRVLVTRPQPDGGDTAEKLAVRGHEAVLAPLLEIHPEPGATVDPDDAQAVLVTSANGARALAAAIESRDIPVFAVGASTAASAREAGFLRIESADGDVVALADLVCARLDPKHGRLLHVAGSATAGDLSSRLSAEGFDITRTVLYRAEKAKNLPESTVLALKQGQIDAITLFSPRTAAGFVELAIAAGLEDACRSIHAICLSRAVAENLAPLAFLSVRVAQNPDQEHLFAALDAIGT